MTIHLATDHAGFALKETIKTYLENELQLPVHDHGAFVYDESDDYPDLIAPAVQAVAAATADKAIIFGGSGQGEAMVANRYPGIRATVFYGEPAAAQADADGQVQSMVTASRRHNDANVLSLGARFLTEESAVAAVTTWLQTEFVGDERHVRRNRKLDALPYEG